MAGYAARCVVYVDGLNLHYGAIHGSNHRWLDLQRMAEMLRNEDELVAVRYFITRNPTFRDVRQDVYLRALATRPLIDVIEGRFKRKRVRCRVAACDYLHGREFQVFEEKRTDVAIAVHMMQDAFQNVCDNVVLISGDSDLVPPLRAIKAAYPHKRIIVYVPTRNRRRGAAVELRSASDTHRELPLAILPHAQLPDPVRAANGGLYARPVGW